MRNYIKPELEVVKFQLNEAIAQSNYEIVGNDTEGDYNITTYKIDSFSTTSTASLSLEENDESIVVE